MPATASTAEGERSLRVVGRVDDRVTRTRDPSRDSASLCSTGDAPGPPPPLGRHRRSWTSGPSAPELGRFDTRPTCAKRVPSRHGTDRIPASLAAPHSRLEGRAWARHAFRAGATPRIDRRSARSRRRSARSRRRSGTRCRGRRPADPGSRQPASHRRRIAAHGAPAPLRGGRLRLGRHRGRGSPG